MPHVAEDIHHRQADEIIDIEMRFGVDLFERHRFTPVTVEHESWYERGYLYPSRELPADITQSKWHYEMDYEPLSIWKKVTQPTLFLFAEVDEWVPVRQSMDNFGTAAAHLHDVTLRQIAGTDHLMRTQAGEISAEYLDVVLGWLKSRLAIIGS